MKFVLELNGSQNLLPLTAWCPTCGMHIQLGPNSVFYIFRQQGYLLHFLRHAAQSPFFFLQNAVYVTIVSFLAHIIFIFYIKDALKFKCPTLAVKGLRTVIKNEAK
jgi:hypothetical protein